MTVQTARLLPGLPGQRRPPESADRAAGLRGLLREVREELLRLDAQLSAPKSGLDAHAGTARSTALLGREAGGISDRLRRVETLLAEDAELLDWYSDAVVRIRNGWDDLTDAWQAALAEPGQALPAESLSGLINRVTLEIDYLTVPPRVNDNLEPLRPGGVLVFERDFGDEVPNPAHRARLLEWMDAHPAGIHGIVDAPRGVVIKCSPHRWRRWSSWLLIAVPVVVALALSAQASRWVGRLGWSLPGGAQDVAVFLYVAAAYAGALAHVVVVGVKQRQQRSPGPSPGFAVLGNIFLWVHVNETYLLWYALVIPVVGFATMFVSGSFAVASGFVVGYSIDSLLEVGLTRFDKSMAARAEQA